MHATTRQLAVVALVQLSLACSSSDSNPTPTPQPEAAVLCDNAHGPCSLTGDPNEPEEFALKVTGNPQEVTQVKPIPSSPLATIDRDAGVSVQLSDGSILWLFGDTAARAEDGSIDYFTIGTASWSPSTSPTVTTDVVAEPGGGPAPLAVPDTQQLQCENPTDRAGMWPASAVVTPVAPKDGGSKDGGSKDLVTIWFENICLGSAGTLQDRGMSVGTWEYNPSDPPNGRPIVATVLNQRLFDSRSYASAAVLDPRSVEPEAVVYRCENLPRLSKRKPGPCFMARVPLRDAADSSKYREWNGMAFAAQVGNGTPLELPSGATWPIPPGGFTVVYDGTIKRYVMAYSPWPGQVPAIDIRLASNPEGPWTSPITVKLPGCEDTLRGELVSCYAATPQPFMSTEGALGIGYYDAFVQQLPHRGSYVVAQLPIAVTPPPR